MPAHLFDRVHAPIGLDIGAITPEEIAVSIMAELIAKRRNVERDLPHMSRFQRRQAGESNRRRSPPRRRVRRENLFDHCPISFVAALLSCRTTCSSHWTKHSLFPELLASRQFKIFSMAKEIEIKFRIANLTALRRALKRGGFREITPSTHEMNALYDLPGEKLRKKGELLRLRKYGSAWVLTHKAKGKASRPPQNTRGTGNPRGKRRANGCDSPGLGFTPTFRYEKCRAEWSDGTRVTWFSIETPIGNFGEIEGPPRWIDRTAKALGIAPPTTSHRLMRICSSAGSAAREARRHEMTFRAVRTQPERGNADKRFARTPKARPLTPFEMNRQSPTGKTQPAAWAVKVVRERAARRATYAPASVTPTSFSFQ